MKAATAAAVRMLRAAGATTTQEGEPPAQAGRGAEAACGLATKVEEVRVTPDGLPAAIRLREELEEADNEWAMVAEPTLSGATIIAGMESAAAELGNPPALAALIGRACRLHEDMVKRGEAMLKAWRAHRDARHEFAGAADKFWGELQETVERPPAEGPSE